MVVLESRAHVCVIIIIIVMLLLLMMVTVGVCVCLVGVRPPHQQRTSYLGVPLLLHPSLRHKAVWLHVARTLRSSSGSWRSLLTSYRYWFLSVVAVAQSVDALLQWLLWVLVRARLERRDGRGLCCVWFLSFSRRLDCVQFLFEKLTQWSEGLAIVIARLYSNQTVNCMFSM